MARPPTLIPTRPAGRVRARAVACPPSYRIRRRIVAGGEEVRPDSLSDSSSHSRVPLWVHSFTRTHCCAKSNSQYVICLCVAGSGPQTMCKVCSRASFCGRDETWLFSAGCHLQVIIVRQSTKRGCALASLGTGIVPMLERNGKEGRKPLSCWFDCPSCLVS
jgi:hypothetical protein